MPDRSHLMIATNATEALTDVAVTNSIVSLTRTASSLKSVSSAYCQKNKPIQSIGLGHWREHGVGAKKNDNKMERIDCPRLLPEKVKQAAKWVEENRFRREIRSPTAPDVHFLQPSFGEPSFKSTPCAQVKHIFHNCVGREGKWCV